MLPSIKVAVMGPQVNQPQCKSISTNHSSALPNNHM